MRRFLGIKNNCISIVSDKPFVNKDILTIEVPDSLSNISNIDLINNYKIRNNELCSKTSSKNASELKIALVSNWKMPCGVSTYGEYIFPEIIKHIKDFKLFIEENDFPTDDIFRVEKQIVSEDHVVTCWKRGQSLQKLVNSIKEYDPDIILINHEWGIFSDPKHWLSLLTQLSDYRIIVIMHSTFPNHFDKTIVEASIPEIIVHLDAARKCLIEDKNISGKVYVIPHGCYTIENINPLWNIYKSDHTFIQVGFGLRYKAFEDSIRATALLKEKYPDIFFTAIFSETNFAKYEHEIYYQELVALIDSLNIKENVGIIRGFQSDTCIDSFFRTNKAAVFPYKSSGEHFVYGASGACRLAMSKNIPVITSSIPHFSDLPSIRADTPEEIALRLEELFTNAKLKSDQLKKQSDFVIENSWENIAKKYIELF